MSKNEKINKKSNELDIKESRWANLLKMISFIGVLIVIFYPVYLRGLYFETEQLPTEIIIFILFIIYWLGKHFEKDFTFLRTPIEYGMMGFVVVYFLSIFVSVSVRSAISEWLKYCMCFSVFYILTDFLNTYTKKVIALWVMISSALGVCIIGLDAAAGGSFVKILNDFFRSLGAVRDVFFGLYLENRIYSTVQYPNALAAYVMAVFFVVSGLILATEKRWARTILGGISFVLFATFILTQSRGTQLLFPVILLIFGLTLPKHNRVKGITYLLMTSIMSFVIALKIYTTLISGSVDSSTIWKYVLAGVVGGIVIGGVFDFISGITEKISWKIYVGGLVSIVIIAVIGFVYAINASEPLTFKIEADGKAQGISKSISLDPDREYKFVYSVEANSYKEKSDIERNKPVVYDINIYSKSQQNILFGGYTMLSKTKGKETNGREEREIKFNVPEDSIVVTVAFSNSYKNTSTTFLEASIMDVEKNKIVKNIVLKNKYNLEGITNRIQKLSADKSGVARIVFYKDGIKMFKDRWFLGAGGKAWEFLYFSYQSYPYSTTQAHNYPLQVAVETGVLGILALVFLFVILIISQYLYSKKYSREVELEELRQGFIQTGVFSGLMAILFHSFIDFDLSLTAIMLFLWQLIGLFNIEVRRGMLLDNVANKILNLIFISGKKTYSNSRLFFRKIKPLIIFIITVVIMVFPIKFNTALAYSAHANKAIEDNRIDDAIVNIKMAEAVDNLDPKYKIKFADVLRDNSKQLRDKDVEIYKKKIYEADRMIKEAEKLGRNNADMLLKVGAYYIFRGNFEKGFDYMNRALKLRPFSPEMWQNMLQAQIKVSNYYIENGKKDEAIKIIDRALGIVEEVKEVNRRNLDPFILNDDSTIMLERLKYIKDYWGTDKLGFANNVLFYGINDMDVNLDGVPDQWNRIKEVMKLSYIEGKMIVENVSSDSSGFIYTRELEFEKGKYRIEIKTGDSKKIKEIFCYLPDITKDKVRMEKSENSFFIDLYIEKDGKVPLQLYVDGILEVDSILVFSK